MLRHAAAMPAASRPKIGQQLAALAVFDELIGNAQPADAAGVEPGIGGRFEHGRAESAHQRRFFDRDDKTAVANRPQHDFRIERLDEPRIDHADVEPFVCEAVCAASRHAGSSAPQHKDRAVVAPRQDFALAEFDAACVRHRSSARPPFG